MKQIYLIGTCLFILLLASCKEQNNPEDVLKQKQNEVSKYLSFLAINPDSAAFRLIIANKLDSIGDYKNALLQIDTLIHADSSKYGLWTAKANILSDSGNLEEAKHYLEKAISVYPGNEALMSLAEMYANEKRDTCLQIAKRFNDQSNAYADYISALYIYNTNNISKADSLANKSILHNHDFIKSYILKGQILSQKNQLHDALHIYKEALNIEPKNILLLNNVAVAFNQLKQTDSTKKYYLESLSIKPFQPKISEQLRSLK